MRNQFIPVNNSIAKAKAFAQSLNPDWRKSQRILTKDGYVETIDMLDFFQKEGWSIDGVSESRNNNRRVNSHSIKLSHPDLIMKNLKGKTEALANINISSDIIGLKPTKINIGAFRLVCENGLVARDEFSQMNIQHNISNKNMLNEILNGFNQKSSYVLNQFNKLKETELDQKKIISLAVKAAELRFGTNVNFDVNQLLNIHRDEDKGNDLWTVYNRIQENLTKSNLLIDKNGQLIGGVDNIFEDVKINQELFELAESFA
jgi:hypothetical protein